MGTSSDYWYITTGSTTTVMFDERWMDAYEAYFKRWMYAYEAYFTGIDPCQEPIPEVEQKRNYQAENNLVEEF